MPKSLLDFCMERNDFTLLSEWDKEKNEGINPSDVSYGGHTRIWWKCKEGHSWETSVYTRTSGSGCPYCTNRKIWDVSQSLAHMRPEIAKQWHPTKNGNLTPEQVLPGTHRRVWWQCEKGHEWMAEVNSRTYGNGCPFCSNRQIIVGENDLATTHPELAKEWHPTKNGTTTPQMYVGGNMTKVWWLCEKGHEWQAVISSRATNQVGCPVCAGKVVEAGFNDLASTQPDIAAQWHPTKNGNLKPTEVTEQSNKRVWWICDKGHEYKTVIATRSTRQSDCPYCTSRKVLPGFNDLATTHPNLAKEWHPTLNNGLTPNSIVMGSHKRVWWQCSEGHVWKCIVYSRTSKRPTGCPICAGKFRNKLPDYYKELPEKKAQKISNATVAEKTE